MSLLNWGQIRGLIAGRIGVQNTAGVYDFDDSTQPTLDQVNMLGNNAIREIISYDYTFLDDFKSYPFFHIISGVQSVTLSGNANVYPYQPISGTITPFPSDVLAYTQWAENSVQNINSNFAGIPFSGLTASGTTDIGTSVSGSQTFTDWTGSGYWYNLDEHVGKIQGVWIQNGNGANGQSPVGFGIQLSYINWHDLNTGIPVNPSIAEGTPFSYSEFPGLGYMNNRAITFFPEPYLASGMTFQVHYVKEHVDFSSDASYQTVIPQKFQEIIVYATLEKIAESIQDERWTLWNERKESLIADMQTWDANNPNKMNTWRDFSYRNGSNAGNWNSEFNTSTNQPL